MPYERWLLVGMCACLMACDNDLCDDLEGRAFESVELLPCGATDCAWAIHFRNGRFNWKHDTDVDTGSIACDGESISATRDSDGAALTGSYDAAAELLTWDGKSYRPSSP